LKFSDLTTVAVLWTA